MLSFRTSVSLCALIFFMLHVALVSAGNATSSIRPGVYNEGLGSQLLLKADGRFDWHVGPRDNARVVGRWRVREHELTLIPDPPAGKRFSPGAGDLPWNDWADRALDSALRHAIETERVQSCPYIASIYAAMINAPVLVNELKVVPDRDRAVTARAALLRALQGLQQRIDAYHASAEAGRVADGEQRLAEIKVDVSAVFTAELERMQSSGKHMDEALASALDGIHARCTPLPKMAGTLKYAVMIENAPGTRYSPQVRVWFRTVAGDSPVMEARFREAPGEAPKSWSAWASDAPVLGIDLFWTGGPVEGLRIEAPRPGHVRRIVFDDLGRDVPVFDGPVKMTLVGQDLLMADTEWRYEWRRPHDDED